MVSPEKLRELKARLEQRSAPVSLPESQPLLSAVTGRPARPLIRKPGAYAPRTLAPQTAPSWRPILRLRTTPPPEPTGSQPAASAALPEAAEATSAPPSSSRRQRRCVEARELLTQLAERWPAAFADTPRPLKVGIHHDLRAVMSDVDPRVLRLALSQHTRRHEYITALLVAGTPRIDLEGNACGEVTAEQVAGLQAARISAIERGQRRACARQQEEAARARKVAVDSAR
jgi:hypothetical protein